ncbi:hypothetical protein BMI91_16930 [Thioclava sediminum]|uniref:Uncharacterized protein n=1 Tax=Thioclava sediminum TaxID=1915319 RepID=A0ABX3MTV3_9RHOB|nr:hypothetical protein [Thioclava sediminum]OOY23127.1 hypothetical protein BMI91_16930 [Thioclava sediminum]
MTQSKKAPPRHAKRVNCVADLPKDRSPASFEVINANSKSRVVILEKRRRQILELLTLGPVYCASPVRISDIVYVLKREIGLEVDTEFYPGDRATGAGDYGVYFLRSRVRRLDGQEVAA